MRTYELAFERLLAVAKALGGQDQSIVGLWLDERLENGGYDSTPANAVTFAWTTGDGVHYSFVVEDQLLERGLFPVVMTVPHGGASNNVILGQDLIEFLNLGCRRGYFGLEDLIYDRPRAISELASPEFPGDSCTREISVLQALIKEFGLRPWQDVEARLVELEQLYSGSVNLRH